MSEQFHVFTFVKEEQDQPTVQIIHGDSFEDVDIDFDIINDESQNAVFVTTDHAENVKAECMEYLKSQVWQTSNTCVLCGAMFPSQAKLIGHCNTVHTHASPTKSRIATTIPNITNTEPNIPTTKSSVDDNIFVDKNMSAPDYEYEIKYGAFPPSKRYACPRCGKEFNVHSNMLTHLASHSDIRCYKCILCEKRFKLKGTLETHLLTHSSIKNYKCHLCDKSYKLKGNLKQHIKTSHNENPDIYKCQYCSKQFLHKGNLKTHIDNIHYGLRPFACTFCPKKFKMKQQLQVHMKGAHKETTFVVELAEKDI